MQPLCFEHFFCMAANEEECDGVGDSKSALHFFWGAVTIYPGSVRFGTAFQICHNWRSEGAGKRRA